MKARDVRRIGVSVVLPVRNGAPWLRDVVRAIFASEGAFDLDVIAIDDGSTDGSLDLLEELARERPMRVLAGPRAGSAA